MSKIVEAAVKLTGTVDPSLKAAVDAAKKTVSGLNFKDMMKSAASGAIGLASAVGSYALEAGKYLLDLGEKYQEAENTIRIGTGATGDDLEAFMGLAKEAYESVPNGLDECAKAIADYNTLTGFTGEELKDLSVKALDASKMLGIDLGTTIESSSKAFQAWGMSAEDASVAMDYVWKASQSTGTSFDSLMSKAQSMAPTFQELGFTFEDSVALIGQLDKAGVNSSEVMSAMKKSMATMAKEGLTAREGFQQYTDAIKSAASETEAAQIAMDVFGSKAGPTMAKHIREGKLEIESLVDELTNSEESIKGAAAETRTLGDMWEMVKHQAENALEPLGTTLLSGLESLMPTISALMDQITPMITDVCESLGPAISEVFWSLEDVFVEVGPMITDAIGQVAPIAAELGTTIIPPLAEVISALLPPLMELGMSLIPPIAQAIMMVVQALTPLISAILPPLQTVISALIPLVSSFMQAMVQLLSAAIQPLIGPLSQLVNALLPPLAGLFQNVCNIGASLVGALSPVVGIFNNIASAVGGAISALSSFISKAAEIGGGVLSGLGSLLGFAEGGFTMGPSLAGEDPNYPTEAVISFNPAVRSRNLAYWAAAGRMLGVGDEDITLNAKNSKAVTYDLTGLTFAPQITVNGNGDAGNIMDALEEMAPRFIDFVMNKIREKEEGSYVGKGSFVY